MVHFTIELGKKYFRPFLLINLSVILFMVFCAGIKGFIFTHLEVANALDFNNSFWGKYFLPSLFFLAWAPAQIWLNIGKARIVNDEGMSIAIDKSWKKVRAGGWFVLKGYLLFSVIYSGLWFGIYDLISTFEVSFKWLHWVGYGFSLFSSLLIGAYFPALYCRFSSTKIPSFIKTT